MLVRSDEILFGAVKVMLIKIATKPTNNKKNSKYEFKTKYNKN